MLTSQQRWLVAASVVVAVVGMTIVLFEGLRHFPPLPIVRVQPTFDSASAMDFTRVIAETYPDRVTGSPAATRAAQYLSSEFERLGYRVSDDDFNMWLAGRRVEGQNVIAELPGESPESVAIIAHYDSQFTSHQAAEDNASGVGVLLELARTLHDKPRYRGLIFVATDAEEWGMIGARALGGFLESRQTLAVISIDYLTAGKATAVVVDCEGQKAGYTPIWLRRIIHQSAALQSVPIKSPSPFQEWTERAVEVSSQDQGPLLHGGIPALNLSTASTDEAAARARYHSEQDVFQDFDPATFQMVGATVEQAVAFLDWLQPDPPRDVKYLSLGGNRWLDHTTVEWLQVLGLIPFMVAAVLGILNFEDDDFERPALTYVRPLLYALPLVAAYAALHVLTSTGILARYELYPATPKDPFLYTIPVRVLAPLVAVVAIGYVVVRIVRLFMPPPPAVYPAWKRVLAGWMYLIVVWALYVDPFGMWLFLGPMAYALMFLANPSNWLRRLGNAALLLVGAAPFVAMLYFFGKLIFLGWRILWYLVLQAAYGVWSPGVVLLAILVVTVWFQALVRAALAPPPAPNPPLAPRLRVEDEAV